MTMEESKSLLGMGESVYISGKIPSSRGYWELGEEVSVIGLLLEDDGDLFKVLCSNHKRLCGFYMYPEDLSLKIIEQETAQLSAL